MDNAQEKKKRLKRFTVSLLPLAVMAMAIFIISLANRPDTGKFIQKYEKTLHALEREAAAGLNELSALDKQKGDPAKFFHQKEKEFENLYNEKGIVYLVYENDSLIFWSDHSPAVENYRKEVCLDNPLAKLRNGWYEVICNPNQNTSRHLLALILLKNEYSYQNKYLVSEFPKWYHVPDNSELKEITPGRSSVVKTMNGNPLFELVIDEAQLSASILDYVMSGLYVVFFALFIVIVNREIFERKIFKSSLASFFTFAVILAGFRFIMTLGHLPALFYKTPLYDAAVFGNADSFWFGYLGDILINSVLFFVLAIVFQKRVSQKTGSNKILFLLVSLTFLIAASVAINNIIRSMVENSHISFRINDIFSLNFYSYLGFFATGCLFFGFSFFADKIVKVLLQYRNYKVAFYSTLGSALILQSTLHFILGEPDLVAIVWPYVIIVCTYLLQTRKRSYSFSYGLPFIICFSIVSAHLFLKEERIKELGTRKVYAENLSNQQDDVVENLFVDLEKKIRQDVKLKNIIFYPPVNSLDLEQRIRQVYFSGYWERFDILISVVDSACVPLIKTTDPVHGNNSYFDQQIEARGRPTVCQDLYFMENPKERTRYVARIKIDAPAGMNRKPALLYVELEPKLNPDVIGFPELLLDRSVKTNIQLSDYSYAIYKNNKLVMRSGKYNYNYSYEWEHGKENDFNELKENAYHHLVYSSEETNVVLSMPQDTLKGGFTANSYFFAFFSLMMMAFLFLREVSAGKKEINTSLNARIQLLLVLVVLVSLLSFGIGTFIFVRNQFEAQNIETLNQRTKSVYADLQGKFGELEEFRENYREYTAIMLSKVSNVFLTDVTLFDLKGNLYASSQPRLFEEGIISKKMNPRAFKNVVSAAITDLVLKENVGKLQYYSSYQPFYNKRGKLMAYLNLPYFAKQSEQEKEISLYITALINIYVILFAISTIAALFISNLVTKPLRIIQQRFSKIKFGKANEPIAWKEKDEIGALVNEYNKMIAELEQSADKLAKSERETAWREMAKQVAHEIKNPLTPMKLTIQHLQRTLDGTPPAELKERVNKISAMLIEQIETLSHIASEFSAFAKMPKAVIEEIRITELVEAVVHLFKDTENVEVIFSDLSNGAAVIKGDKDQVNRVFTNLIKNAIQAIPYEKEGKIEVKIEQINKHVLVSVKDNGTGVHPDVMDKIFMPNFSTKTEGMGLGLAMVKNIVESFNGKIWFETKQGEGTIFYVEFETLY